MAVDVKVPAVGESVQEGMIHKWHKANGDYIKMDEVLVELETDKATVEIVAEAAGVVQLLKKEGDVVKVGEVLAKIDTEKQAPAGGAKAETKKPSAPAPQPASQIQQPPSPPKAAAASKAAAESPLSPAVARMVAEHQLSPAQIAGTGRGGRITKTDVVHYLDNPKDNRSGAAAPGAPAAAAAKSAAAIAVDPVVLNTPQDRTERREPMSMLRRRIAERLLEAQRTNAILTTFNEVDMSEVMNLRKQYKDKFQEKHGIGLGFMSFFISACVEALKAFPAVNGHIEGNEIVYHNYCDIGVAVSTNRGLMVPIIRNCQLMSFAQIEQQIMYFAQKGREGKIAMDDLQGGTFTVSNGGVFGSLVSTPIINPPQSAILGMHKIQDRPVVVNGQIVIRPMMYLALSYDHRIIDGKEAVSFLVKIKDCIEDPSRLLLGV